MDNKTDIVFVNPHTEGVRRNDKLYFSRQELILRRFSICIVKAGMVKATRFLEEFTSEFMHIFRVLPRSKKEGGPGLPTKPQAKRQHPQAQGKGKQQINPALEPSSFILAHHQSSSFIIIHHRHSSPITPNDE